MIYRQFFLTALVALLAALFTACGKDAHENEYPLPEGQGALIVGLEEPGGTTVGDLTLYLFGSDGTTALRKSYDSPRTLAAEYIPVDAGSYTLAVVANVGNDALPQETTVADLTEWLKAHAGDYPGLLTASAQIEVIPGDIHRLTLELKETEGWHKRNQPRHCDTAARPAGQNDARPSGRPFCWRRKQAPALRGGSLAGRYGQLCASPHAALYITD